MRAQLANDRIESRDHRCDPVLCDQSKTLESRAPEPALGPKGFTHRRWPFHASCCHQVVIEKGLERCQVPVPPRPLPGGRLSRRRAPDDCSALLSWQPSRPDPSAMTGPSFAGAGDSSHGPHEMGVHRELDSESRSLISVYRQARTPRLKHPVPITLNDGAITNAELADSDNAPWDRDSAGECDPSLLWRGIC